MKYLVLQPIGGTVENPDGWKVGSEIELDSVRAALHLAAGNVAKIDQPAILVSATDEAATEVTLVETKRKKAAE